MEFDFSNLMNQAQKMQQQLEKMKGDLEKVLVVGEAGAGMVKVEMTGHRVVKSITIDESLRSESLVCMQDLLVAATNDALSKVDKALQNTLGAGFPPNAN